MHLADTSSQLVLEGRTSISLSLSLLLPLSLFALLSSLPLSLFLVSRARPLPSSEMDGVGLGSVLDHVLTWHLFKSVDVLGILRPAKTAVSGQLPIGIDRMALWRCACSDSDRTGRPQPTPPGSRPPRASWRHRLVLQSWPLGIALDSRLALQDSVVHERPECWLQR